MKKRRGLWRGLFLVAICLFLMPGSISKAEEEEPQTAEYPVQYELAVQLADYLKDDPYMIYNKTYTAEQEVDLQELVATINEGKESDREKVEALLTHIRGYMENGPTHDLSSWDMLCDGETLQGDGENKKKAGRPENFCFAFSDLCRMQGIPCFMVEDCRKTYVEYTICIVYLESEGKWYFVDVADTKGQLVTQQQAYATFGADFFPLNLALDYDENCAVNEIHLSRESMTLYSGCESQGNPKLAYDKDEKLVKTYIKGNELADGETYYTVTTKVGENGEAPSGWLKTVSYETRGNTRNKITYLSYAVHGVFLRGRVRDDSREYDLKAAWNSIIPFYCEIGNELESEEHVSQNSQMAKNLQNKAIKIADALTKDENFVFDTKFTEEEEAYLRNALNEALSWDYIQSKKEDFDKFGIELGEEGDPLSDRAKAQAICFYIRDHVQYGGGLYVNSYGVLTTGYAICGGYTLLFRDLCVMADIPCFALTCATSGEDIEGRVFSDHANNLLKVDGEWIFADPTGIPRIGYGGWYPTAFNFGYSTFGQQNIFIDFEHLRKEYYGKWLGAYLANYYYEFDDSGQLGVYLRDRKGNPIQDDLGVDKTDENGKMCIPNGMYTLDAAGDTENGTKIEEWRYVYYVQQGKMVEGRNVINGKEYNFDTRVYSDGVSYYCQKVEKLSEKYYIAKLSIGSVEDQEYTGKDICPVPVVTHGDKVLELGKDFTISYEGNKEITREQETRFTIQGIGDYTGYAVRTFRIIKRDISDMEVTLSQTEYTWGPQAYEDYGYRPEVTMDLDPLDYVINYYEYTGIGKARVEITARNHCTGSITRYYNIKPCKMDAKYFKIEGTDTLPLKNSYEYNFRAIEPNISVNWYLEDGTKLRSLSQSYECQVSYSDSDKIGTATITVEGTGNFEGSLSCTYEITPYNIQNSTGLKQCISYGSTIASDIPRAYYTGKPVIPDLPGITYVTENTPSLDGLERDVDFTVSATNNIHVGTGTLIIQGIGRCTGTLERPIRILPKAIKEQDISLSSSEIIYNGEIQKPTVTVDGLTEGTEYQVTYERWEDGQYVETEPKEVGNYVAALRLLTEDVEYHYTVNNIDSEDETCYRIGFSIVNEGQSVAAPTPSPSTPKPSAPTVSPGGDTGSGNGDSGNDGSGNGASGNGGSGGNAGTENGGFGGNTGEGSSLEGTTDNSETASDGKTSGITEEEKGNTLSQKISSSQYKIKKLKVIAKKKARILQWAKVKKATGYEVQVSQRKDFKKARTVKIRKSKTSYRITNLKKKKKYYVRIRVYVKQNGSLLYGKWSKSKSVKGG